MYNLSISYTIYISHVQFINTIYIPHVQFINIINTFESTLFLATFYYLHNSYLRLNISLSESLRLYFAQPTRARAVLLETFPAVLLLHFPSVF